MRKYASLHRWSHPQLRHQILFLFHQLAAHKGLHLQQHAMPFRNLLQLLPTTCLTSNLGQAAREVQMIQNCLTNEKYTLLNGFFHILEDQRAKRLWGQPLFEEGQHEDIRKFYFLFVSTAVMILNRQLLLQNRYQSILSLELQQCVAFLLFLQHRKDSLHDVLMDFRSVHMPNELYLQFRLCAYLSELPPIHWQ